MFLSRYLYLHIFNYMGPAVVLALLLGAPRWIYVLNPPSGLGSSPVIVGLSSRPLSGWEDAPQDVTTKQRNAQHRMPGIRRAAKELKLSNHTVGALLFITLTLYTYICRYVCLRSLLIQ